VQRDEGERGQGIDLHQRAARDRRSREHLAVLLQRDEREDDESRDDHIGARRVLHRGQELEEGDRQR